MSPHVSACKKDLAVVIRVTDAILCLCADYLRDNLCQVQGLSNGFDVHISQIRLS